MDISLSFGFGAQKNRLIETFIPQSYIVCMKVHLAQCFQRWCLKMLMDKQHNDAGVIGILLARTWAFSCELKKQNVMYGHTGGKMENSHRLKTVYIIQVFFYNFWWPFWSAKSWTICTNQVKGILGKICMKLFPIWTSGSGGEVV